VGAALLASADGYTPKANRLIEGGREELGSLSEVAYALAENLPPPKTTSGRRRRRRRRKKKGGGDAAAAQVKAGKDGTAPNGDAPKKSEQAPEPAAAEA
jgi:hypothetical protein